MQSLPPYSLDQLADASGEKPRTIRSWIKEGLLPPAVGAGRGAFYGQEHMNRLLFIKRLRKETGTHLPLAMIKDILDRLYASDDPDVVRRVAHGEETLRVAGLTGPLGVVAESAQAYEAPPRASLMMSVAPPSSQNARRPDPPLWGTKTPSNDGPWTSIQIQDDVELRLRSDDPERVAWLARLARRVRDWIREGEP